MPVSFVGQGGLNASLSDWIAQWSQGESTDTPDSNAPLAKFQAGQAASLRSWTQAALDEAILEYRNDPANEFEVLREEAGNPSTSYFQKARALFGRNAIARKLGVRGKAMISRSAILRAISAELGLSRDAAGLIPLYTYKRISMPAALRQRAGAEGGSVVDDLISQEAHDKIEQLLQQGLSPLHFVEERRYLTDIVEAILVLLDTRVATPAHAIDLTHLAIEQVCDQHQQVIITKRP